MLLAADKSDDIIGLTLISPRADSDSSCSQLIRQHLAISDSLSVCRILPLKIAPPADGSEVENESDCTFQ
jgi:hypothetical protein